MNFLIFAQILLLIVLSSFLSFRFLKFYDSWPLERHNYSVFWDEMNMNKFCWIYVVVHRYAGFSGNLSELFVNLSICVDNITYFRSRIILKCYLHTSLHNIRSSIKMTIINSREEITYCHLIWISIFGIKIRIEVLLSSFIYIQCTLNLEWIITVI